MHLDLPEGCSPGLEQLSHKTTSTSFFGTSWNHCGLEGWTSCLSVKDCTLQSQKYVKMECLSFVWVS